MKINPKNCKRKKNHSQYTVLHSSLLSSSQMNSVESNPIQSTVLQCTALLYSQPCTPVYCKAEYTHRRRGLSRLHGWMHWQYTPVQSVQPLHKWLLRCTQHCTAESSRQLFKLRRRRSCHCTALDCTGCYYYGCTSCTMFFLRGELSFSLLLHWTALYSPQHSSQQYLSTLS